MSKKVLKTIPTEFENGEALQVVVPTKKRKKAKKPAPPSFVKNKTFNSTKLIKALIDTRFERGMSIEAAGLACKPQLSKSSFHQIEAKGTCNLDTLAIVCNWLGVPVQHFFS